MPTKEEVSALLEKAGQLTDQHEKMFEEHGLPLDMADHLLGRDDVPAEIKSKLEQEIAASREKSRTDEFADARAERKSHHKSHRMI